MTNYPGPFELRFNYDCTINSINYEHQFRLSLDLTVEGDPGDDFDQFSSTDRDGGSTALDTLAESVLAEVVELYHTTANFTSVELWEYVTGTFNANYITQYTVVTNGAGLNAGACQSYRQDVLSFRTTNGGVAKADFRHSSSTSAARNVFPTSSSEWNAVMSVLSSAQTPFIGRDNGYIFAPLAWLGGQNEKMFKDINR